MCIYSEGDRQEAGTNARTLMVSSAPAFFRSSTTCSVLFGSVGWVGCVGRLIRVGKDG